MGKRRSNYKRETHLFDTNKKCLHRYYELLKEARVWNNSGQYWLGTQCEILAGKLLRGEESAVTTIIKTEDHFYKTKKHIH